MTEEKDSSKHDFKGKKMMHHKGSLSAIYCLGLVGALVYYIQYAPSFVDGLVGFFKALVWPALLVYKMLEFLKM